MDTSFTSMSFLPVMKPKTGLILTLTGKSGTHLKHDWPNVSWWLVYVANAMDAVFKWRAARWKVVYDHVFIVPQGDDLDQMTEWYEQEKINPIIGEQFKFDDLENARRVCGIVYAGKGGIGNYVLTID